MKNIYYYISFYFLSVLSDLFRMANSQYNTVQTKQFQNFDNRHFAAMLKPDRDQQFVSGGGNQSNVM